MKLLIAVFGLLLASVSAVPRLDDQLRELIETLRQQMPCGFPSRGIPPLAPYTNLLHQFNFNNSGIHCSGNLTDLIVTGIDGFEVKQLSYATLLMKLSFDVNFNRIKFFSQYYARGGFTVFGKPISLVGDGNFDLVLENLRINGSLRLRPTTSNGLKIWGLKSSFNMDGVKSQTTGISNNAVYSSLFNEWVEEFFRILVEEHKDEIGNRVGSYVAPLVNNLLEDVSLLELVGLILGYGPSGPLYPICQVN